MLHAVQMSDHDSKFQNSGEESRILSYKEAFIQHTETVFKSSPCEHVWDKNFIDRAAPGLTCLEFQPSDVFGYFSYVSCGLATLLPDQDVKHEYVIASPFRTGEHSELMNMLAAALLSRKTFFRLGDIVSIGRPWIYGSEAEYLLVALPYPYGPKLEVADSALPNLSVVWLLPIYASEVDYYESQGLEALEKRFDEHAIEFCDLSRGPVC